MKIAFVHWQRFKDPNAKKLELTEQHYDQLAKALELYRNGTGTAAKLNTHR